MTIDDYGMKNASMFSVTCRLKMELCRQRHVNGDEMIMDLVEHEKSCNPALVCYCYSDCQLSCSVCHHGTHTTCPVLWNLFFMRDNGE